MAVRVPSKGFEILRGPSLPTPLEGGGGLERWQDRWWWWGTVERSVEENQLGRAHGVGDRPFFLS